MPSNSDIRICSIRPLISPALLEDELPLAQAGAAFIARARRAQADVILRTDDLAQAVRRRRQL